VGGGIIRIFLRYCAEVPGSCWIEMFSEMFYWLFKHFRPNCKQQWKSVSNILRIIYIFMETLAAERTLKVCIYAWFSLRGLNCSYSLSCFMDHGKPVSCIRPDIQCRMQMYVIFCFMSKSESNILRITCNFFLGGGTVNCYGYGKQLIWSCC